jgi:hypothetical protein
VRAVETIACDAERAGKQIYITGMSDEIADTMTGLGADCCLDLNAARYNDRVELLRNLRDEYAGKLNNRPGK